jgi:hypothetical protein
MKNIETNKQIPSVTTRLKEKTKRSKKRMLISDKHIK